VNEASAFPKAESSNAWEQKHGRRDVT